MLYQTKCVDFTELCNRKNIVTVNYIFDKNFVKATLLYSIKESLNRVWKLQNFTATIFSQNFRESNFLPKVQRALL